jgi:hypothetical protein
MTDTRGRISKADKAADVGHVAPTAIMPKREAFTVFIDTREPICGSCTKGV